MVVNGKYFNNVGRVIDNRIAPKPNKIANGDFAGILSDKLIADTEVKFSKHAEMRLRFRNINISPEQKERLADAVNRAENKGVKDSLVLLDNLAFVINVKNKTVITAINSNELKENVITNIDGAVFA